jgi:hypothetical protein
VVEGRSSGALNLYATEPEVFNAEDEATAARWAEQATGALAVALRIADSDSRVESLLGGLDSRATIGEAVGLLMAQERCTVEQAFDLLRIASQRRNVELRDVAAGIVGAFRAGAGRPVRALVTAPAPQIPRQRPSLALRSGREAKTLPSLGGAPSPARANTRNSGPTSAS